MTSTSSAAESPSLEAELADTKNQLAERTDELAAARGANRQLFTELNAPSRELPE